MSREDMLLELGQIFRTVIWRGYRQGMETLEQFGLTVPQAMTLLVLDAHGGQLPMGELAQQTRHAGATLTGIIDRLEEAGIVIRERSAADRRVIQVRITDEGRGRLEQVNAHRLRELAEITSDFDDEELHVLTAQMLKFGMGIERNLSTKPQASTAQDATEASAEG